MSVKQLVQLERANFFDKETALRVASDEVVDFGREFQSLVDDLIETMYHHEIAIGLAAPQIGINKKVSVIAMDRLEEEADEPVLVIVNPRIVSFTGGKDAKMESCMSLPHYRGEVIRRTKMRLEFQDRHGNSKSLLAKGFLSRVLAHEIDHLNGILYIDEMEAGAELEPVEFFK